MNLLATGRAAAVLGAHRIVLSPKVRAEALFIYADDAKTQRQPINEDLLEREAVAYTSIDLDERERILAVRFAAFVDDGEAEALAIALAREIPILSDDVAAVKVALAHGIPLLTTLGLLQNWSVGRNASEVREALTRLRSRASYGPPRSHPQRGWFLSHIEGSA